MSHLSAIALLSYPLEMIPAAGHSDDITQRGRVRLDLAPEMLDCTLMTRFQAFG